MQWLQNHLALQIEDLVCKQLGLENRGNREIKRHVYGKCHIQVENFSQQFKTMRNDKSDVKLQIFA